MGVDMIHVVWEFLVEAEDLASFERAYGPSGAWAQLFARYPGFRGTTLVQDRTEPRRYLTIDTWDTADRRAAMLEAAAEEYTLLDASFLDLTEAEREIGVFEQID